ncbi:MAG: primosomal protein N' (replication factor Y) [Gammaproteobacteria bacterium]|jgi:primosomal protein N' (replication factor Y)
MARRASQGEPTLFDLGEAPPPERAAPPGLYVQVALDLPVRREFTYAVPEELRATVARGSRVAVPFGRGRTAIKKGARGKRRGGGREIGVIVGLAETTDVPAGKLRDVLDVLDLEPVVGEDLLDLTHWIAEEYACSWGEALAAVLPAPLKREGGTRKLQMAEAAPGVGKKELEALETRAPQQHRALRTLIDLKGPIEVRDLLRQLNLSRSPVESLARHGLVRIESVEVEADPLAGGGGGDIERRRPDELSPAQSIALAALSAHLEKDPGPGAGKTVLLHGVTGSGKTEVYLRAIERALELGRSAIVLVPEIALTPQTVGWFRSRFGSVAVLHSRMTDSQRLSMWRRLKRGETKVVVGARSAIFAPLQNVGVIVVDEEHEPSFKQGSVPRYHARDVAVERARRCGAVCVLGSATPALESWSAAQAGRYQLIRLPERVGGGKPPTAHVVDMRREAGKEGTPLFSRLLLTLLEETIEAGELAILFLNRRGFVPVLWCPGCKTTVRCSQCDVSLTYHRRIHRMVCHGCCDELKAPEQCPTCTRPGLRFLGAGSERVEATLKKLFPEVRVGRMDSDTMRRREDYENTLGAFGRGELDVLVGTQMIAKGLDFPRVTLVGVLSADMALHLPDFRAAERTFQLIAQVSGRAGRGELPGRIVVQTVAPENKAIRHAVANDYVSFAREEDEERAELGYPPHGRLLRVLLEDESEDRVTETGTLLAEELDARFTEEGIQALGPAPCPIALQRGRHRHHILVKAAVGNAAFAAAREYLVDRAAEISRPHISIDVEPSSLL